MGGVPTCRQVTPECACIFSTLLLTNCLYVLSLILFEILTGQKAVLAEVRQREFEAYNQVKNSCHMVEQAQLEKAEVCHAEILKFVELISML